MRHGRFAQTGWLAAFALVSLTGCGSGGGPGERVRRAEQMLTRGDYGAAMIEIKNALQEKPDDPAAELALARATLMLGNLGASTKALTDAQSHGADAEAVSRLRVRVLLQKGAHEELIGSLESSALTLGESERELARAKALSGLRRCPEAIKSARALLGVPEAATAARIVLAECYAQSGRRDFALEMLEAAVRQRPDAAEAWLALGRLKQLSGSNAAAETAWQKAAGLAAGQLTVLQQINMETTLSDLQLARGDIAAARTTHGRMLRIAPQGALTELLDARLLMVGGEHEAAVNALRGLVNGFEGLDAARMALVSALIASEKREQALAEISRLAGDRPEAATLRAVKPLLEKQPTLDADAVGHWMAAAGAHVLLGQSAMARQALDRAAAIAPQSARIARTRVELELRTENGAQGLRLAEAFATKYPDDPLALPLLAQAQRAQNQLPQALETLQRLQAARPSAETAAMIFAVQREVNPSQSLATLQSWVAQHPDARRTRALLADGLLRAGRNREAIAEYETLLAADPTDVPALNNLAWLYYLEKDSRAIDTARKAWQLAPKAASVVDTYGWLLVEGGAPEEGLRILVTGGEAGVLIDPQSRYHHAAALARNGQRDAARRALGELLAEAAAFPGRVDAEALAGSLR
jgi:cellulose synthase operon protein C